MLLSILVAATGLPSPQKDHAVRMARFASECMESMAVLTAEAAVALGQDTTNLKVSAGVGWILCTVCFLNLNYVLGRLAPCWFAFWQGHWRRAKRRQIQVSIVW